jgi:phage-related protein
VGGRNPEFDFHANNGIIAMDDDEPKPLFWIATARRDLKRFSVDVRNVFGYALWQAQNGGKHPDAKPLKGFGGAGVLEVLAQEQGNAFRVVYSVRFAGAVYVLHAFQKKSKRGIQTPQEELELVRSRLKIAEEHYEAWRKSLPDEA